MEKNNDKKREIKKKVRELLKEYFAITSSEFEANTNYLPLSVAPYDGNDIANGLEAFFDNWPTSGPRVEALEEQMSNLVGKKNSIMLNSGGSANFLILYLLTSHHAEKDRRLVKGDEVITPAVTWSTTVGPIIQNGLVPVFADVQLSTYDIDIKSIKRCLSDKTRALMIVHPLGHPCNMDKIMELCEKENLILIEDNCESIGAKYSDSYLGSFGDFSSFSFYFSHHVSSIEGGMICTDNDNYADALRSMRANGWFREIRSESNIKRIISENPHLEKSFLFPFIGFNLKSTDFAAGLVSDQLTRFEDFMRIRSEAARTITACLEKYKEILILPIEREKCKHTWFTYPIVLKDDCPFTKSKFVKHLSDSNIENRPIIAGNIVHQPFLKDYKYRADNLPTSDLVMKNGFFIGLHHHMDKNRVKYLCNVLDKFLGEY